MKRFTLDEGTMQSPVLEVDESLAQAAIQAKKLILEMLTAEEKYDAMIENFAEFERDLLSATVDYKMFGVGTFDWFNTTRNKIDRRFFNLLSACRSYSEFMTHSSNTIASNIEILKNERSKHFDESFAYELMEALRNHVTYAGHAAHVLTFSASREDLPDDNFVLNYSTPKLELLTDRLVENKKLSSGLRKKIMSRGDRINFLPLLREYIRRLSEIHDRFRSVCRPGVTGSLGTLEEIVNSFRAANPAIENLNALRLIEYHDGDKIREFWILSLADRIGYFEAKNRVLSNLERSNVTNAMPKNG